MEVIAKVTCLLVLLVVYCEGNTSFKVRSCPRVEVMKSFDMEKFSGVWYVQQRFNPMCSCIKMVFGKNKEGEYNITETGVPFGLDIEFIPPLRTARTLTFPSDETESIFRMKRKFFPMIPATYGVISTDYDNYAALWGCDPFLLGSIQNVNILTREKEANEDYIKEAKSSFEKFNIDLSMLGVVDQSHCSSSKTETATETSDYSNMVIG